MFLKRSVFALILSVAAACVFLFGGALKTDRERDEKRYKGIVTLWHIDTFEGGTGSRKRFLSDVAIKYEKKRDGTLIMVIGYTIGGAEEEMKNGNYPDMISFGNGLKLDAFTSLDLKNDYPEGTFSGKTAAAVWAKGEYALFTKDGITGKEIEELTVSQSDYNLPLVAFALSGYSADKITVKPPADAYSDFVNGATDCLLGTQRDVIRLINRGYNATVTPLTAFSDLNQFIAITGDNPQKNACAREFIDLLLSDMVQSDLIKIGLFSVYGNTVYEDGNLLTLSGIKNRGISAFYGREKIEEIRAISYSASAGDKNALEKLNNVAFLP